MLINLEKMNTDVFSSVHCKVELNGFGFCSRSSSKKERQFEQTIETKFNI